MKSYYDLLKSSRVEDFDSNKSLNYTLTPNLTLDQGTSKSTPHIDTVYNFIIAVKNKFIHETNYNVVNKKNKLSKYHLLDDCYLISEYKHSYRYDYLIPKHIFSTNDNIISLLVIERLKEIYNVSSLEELLNVVDRSKPIDQVVAIIRDLIYSEGGELYGFHCYYNRWRDPTRIKTPIRAKKFKIVGDKIDGYLKNRELVSYNKGKFLLPKESNYNHSILCLNHKRIFLNCGDDTINWVFSLNEEHLKERIEVLMSNYDLALDEKIMELKVEDEKLKHRIGEIKKNIETNKNHLNNFNEYKKNLWKWINF